MPHIDYAAVAAHPKRYLSYSDGTDILYAVCLKTSLATYYGQTPGLFEAMSDYDRAQFRAHMTTVGPLRHVRNSPWRALNPGRGEGILLGGCMGNIAYLLSSGDFPWEKHARYILFLEDNEGFVSVDRFSAILSRIEQHPFMERITGVVFGHYAQNVPRELLARMARLGKARNIPVTYCDDFGHGANHAILPIGCRARLDAADGLYYLYE